MWYCEFHHGEIVVLHGVLQIAGQSNYCIYECTSAFVMTIDNGKVLMAS